MDKLLNDVLEYIETHLEEKITIATLAEIAHYSPFHFQRLFQLLIGETIGDYTRNRRMYFASKKLQLSHMKVIDVAGLYGYDSPEAFTRAFKKVYGITPSSLKNASQELPVYAKPEISLRLVANEALTYQIVEKESLYLSGLKVDFSATEILEGKVYPEFWTEHIEEINTIREHHKQEVSIAAGYYDQSNPNCYHAIVGSFSTVHDYDIMIPKSKWVIFKQKGAVKESLNVLWKRIFLEWFPKTEFQHAGTIELEVFPNGDSSDSSYTFEVWIPLLEK